MNDIFYMGTNCHVCMYVCMGIIVILYGYYCHILIWANIKQLMDLNLFSIGYINDKMVLINPVHEFSMCVCPFFF